MRGRQPQIVIVALLVLLLVAAGCAGSDGEATRDADDVAKGGEPALGSLDEPLAAYSSATSDVYADADSWLCRPDVLNDVCDQNLDVTVVEADGSTSVERFQAVEEAPVDCFYVYPTISRDESTNSDRRPSEDEEGYAALNQVARLGEVCRVFAPVYRQTTLTALSGALSGGGGLPASAGEVAYADVLEAWEHYLAEDNGGRGVILVGHSQGASHLNRLVAEEIDPQPEVRERLVSAYLAGWGVDVPEGQVVGGSFDEVPLCEAADQVGCALSWASFRESEPPGPDAFFGRSRSTGEPAACTNPAALAGQSVAPPEAPEPAPVVLSSVFPADPSGGLLTDLGAGGEPQPWLDPAVGEVTTPFVSVPGLLTGQCVVDDGAAFLSVGVHGDPADPRVDDVGGDLTPEWGLHLQDVNLVMGDLVALAEQQAEAYVADRID